MGEKGKARKQYKAELKAQGLSKSERKALMAAWVENSTKSAKRKREESSEEDLTKATKRKPEESSEEDLTKATKRKIEESPEDNSTKATKRKREDTPENDSALAKKRKNEALLATILRASPSKTPVVSDSQASEKDFSRRANITPTKFIQKSTPATVLRADHGNSSDVDTFYTPPTTKETPILPPQRAVSGNMVKRISSSSILPHPKPSATIPLSGSSPLVKADNILHTLTAKMNSLSKVIEQNTEAKMKNRIKSEVSNGTVQVTKKTEEDNAKHRDEQLTTIPDDWQTSHGRLRRPGKDLAGKYEYIAFSAAHIASKPNGVTLGNASFRTLKIRAFLQWQTCVDLPDGEMLVCTVMEAVVKVMLAGQTFNVAKGGMWKIMGGEKFKIRCGGDGGEAELQLVHLA